MRRALAVLWLAGCGAPPPAEAPPPDLAGPVACALAPRIVVEGELLPGRPVALSVASDAPRDLDARWTVPSGALSSPVGRRVTWTPDAKLARHGAEEVVARAAVSAPGCGDENATARLTVDWPPGHRAIVLHNPKLPASLEVAQRYAALRRVPAENLCGVAAADPTQISSADFDPFLDAVLACARPHTHYVVPVWGVPIKVAARIADLSSKKPTTVSLDALLALGKAAHGLRATASNPYYLDANSRTGEYNEHRPFGEYRADTDGDDYFLVARIDGADAAAARALVDRTAQADALAAAGKLAGTVYVDGRYGAMHPAKDGFGSYEWGEWNIIGVETVFKRDGRYPIVADWNGAEFGTAPAPLACPDALYYAGWYSFGHYNDVFTWKPGAIGGHLDSCSACDLRGSRDWSAVALRRGITATFGAVNEPYVAGMPDYDQLFKYLLDGATFGEAAYQSTRLAAWMMVWIGDPLYRPYPKKD